MRGFARYCLAIDPRTEIPPLGLLPFSHQRPSPYFFTEDDIDHLLQAALKIPAKEGFTNYTLCCVFGLLSVSGLRICEALGLTLDDVDLDEGILTIRATKFGKSRLVPLHATTVNVWAITANAATAFWSDVKSPIGLSMPRADAGVTTLYCAFFAASLPACAASPGARDHGCMIFDTASP